MILSIVHIVSFMIISVCAYRICKNIYSRTNFIVWCSTGLLFGGSLAMVFGLLTDVFGKGILVPSWPYVIFSCINSLYVLTTTRIVFVNLRKFLRKNK